MVFASSARHYYGGTISPLLLLRCRLSSVSKFGFAESLISFSLDEFLKPVVLHGSDYANL